MTEYLLPPEAIQHLMDKHTAEASREPEAAREWERLSEPEPETPERILPGLSDVQELPEFDRVVILAVYWGNLSKRSVARHMGCARDTILASIERSQKALRLMLEPEHTEA